MDQLLALVVIAALLVHVASHKQGKTYDVHVHTPIVANTVGPFNNPTETYPYYSLPFCTGSGKQRRHKQDLGEVLSGSRKVATPYEITFMDPVPWRSLCEDYLSAADVMEFKNAIDEDFFFEMFIDDLPLWGYLGEVVHEEFLLGQEIQGAKVYLYPHLHFSLGYNNNQVVSANVTTDTKRKIDITDASIGQEIVFSYSVEWKHTPEIKYAERMKRYVIYLSCQRIELCLTWLSLYACVSVMVIIPRAPIESSGALESQCRSSSIVSYNIQYPWHTNKLY